jgi:amino acid adenylation domain-containing protein/non-ribosomal peptide synthase protein (TIGR01720 family)
MSEFDLKQVMGLLEKANDSGIKISFDNDELVLNIHKARKPDRIFLDELKANRNYLIEYFKAQESVTRAKLSLLQPVSRKENGRSPLSFAQERLWFIDRFQRGIQYHVPWVLRLKGKLDIKALAAAFREIIHRHEVLRSVVREEDGIAYQQATAADTWQLKLTTQSSIGDDKQALQNYLDAYVQQPFDLSEDSMLRANLIHVSDTEHVLVVVCHHIAFDGWSVGIMVSELVELYSAFCEGRQSLLPALPLQYADYAIWQREYQEKEVMQKQLSYWKTKLQQVEPLHLPTDFPRPVVQSLRGDVLDMRIDQTLSNSLQALSKAEGATIFMTLLTAFKILLYRYSGQEDICVGTSIANRPDKKLESLIGFFVNALALRSDLSNNPAFKDLLQQVKTTTLNAYTHQDIPFGKVVENVLGERSMIGNPLFQVMFVLQNTPDVPDLQLGELELDMESFEQVTSKFDLTFDVTQSPAGLYLRIEYCTDLFTPATISQMAAHYVQLLASIVANPAQPIRELTMLNAGEEQKILHEFNKPASVTEGVQTVIHLFEEQALRIPQAVALVCGSRSLTYQQLDQQAAQLAAHLSYLGLGPERLLPICMERSAELVVAILAAWKAGAAYVPIDPAYPAERVQYILDDTKASAIVTTSSLRHLIPAQVNAICIDEVIPDHKQQPLKAASPHNLAYVIYTSGSTGKPKGVMVEHASLLNYCKELYVDENNKGAGSFMHLSFTFDASLTALTVPLLSGKYIVIGTQQGVAVFEDEQLQQHAPYDFIKLTPAHLPLLEGIIDKDPLRYVTRKLVVGGEALQPNHFGYLTRNEAPVEIINEYGPTEATVGCSVWHVYTDKPVEVTGNGISIGHPMNNTTLYITDGNSLAPIGVAGELCIGGIQVARGYLNQPELTAEKFVDDPFSKQGGKLYRTGDMAHWLPDGRIEYLGRRDDQVKIRGYRVETGEIENVLSAVQEIEAACVVTKPDQSSTNKLVAYYVPQQDAVKEKEKQLYRKQVESWQELYETEYGNTEESVTDKVLDFAGWKNSFTGIDIPEEQMLEWLHDITGLILSYKPERVLEIGSGMGLIYYKLAPHIKKYTGTDFSTVSISRIKQRIATAPGNYCETTLKACAAHEVRPDAGETFDTIIINSVIQYFPGEEYLSTVIQKCMDMLQGHGRIIIGDVRDNRLLTLFRARLSLDKTSDSMSIPEFNWMVERELLREEELCLSPAYFNRLRSKYREITHIDITWKQGAAINELTLYRYTVVIHVGIEKEKVKPNWQPWKSSNKEVFLSSMRAGEEMIAIKDMPNHRLSVERLLQEGLKNRSVITVRDLSDHISGIDKQHTHVDELLSFAASKGYRCRFLVHEDPLLMNLLLEKNNNNHFIESPYSVSVTANTGLANIPLFSDICLLLQKDIRSTLQRQLPEYMVPADFVALRQLPLTINGKVDRKFLGRCGDVQLKSKVNYQAPATAAEEQLAAIWSALLQREQVGVSDNFFEIGGHSLLATRVVSAIRKEMGVELNVKDVFLHPNIRSLAVYIAQQDPRKQAPAITRHEGQNKMPLSFAQERLWFIHRLQGSRHYHMPWVFRLKGELHIDALQQSFRDIVDRHEVLRSVIREEDGTGYQYIQPAENWQMNVVSANDIIVKDYIAQIVQQPYDLSTDDMLKVTIVSINNTEHVLVILLHHIAFDGWSIGLMVKELVTLYNSKVTQQLPVLENLPVQYADYAAWQREYLSGDVLTEKLGYWKQQLSGITPLELPVDYARPAIQSVRGGIVYNTVSKTTANALVALAKKEQATLFMTLLAAFKVLLYRYTGAQDICVGTPIAGRQQPQLETLIGFFVNTLALRSQVDGNESFRQLLQRVKQTTVEAYAHQELPFEKVVEALDIPRDMSRNPVFQVMFALHNIPPSGNLNLADVELSSENYSEVTSKFDLSFDITDADGELSIAITYCSDLYEEATVLRMLTHYENILESIALNADITADAVRLLSADEQNLLLHGFNNTTVTCLPQATIPYLFQKQVARHPNATAVVFEDRSLTYGELYAQTNRLAHYLREQGVREDELVPVCLDRSHYMIISLLGILKAGAAYVPMDPAYPKQRIAHIIKDTNARIVICNADHHTLCDTGGSVNIISIDEIHDDLTAFPATRVETDLKPNHLAYVIYTSGSTGTPKGVMNEHAGIVNRLIWTQDYFGLDRSDAILQKTTYCFDVSVWELFWPLIAGSVLVFAKPEGHRDTTYLRHAIEQNNITTIHFVPAMLEVFLNDIEEGDCARLVRVLCSGEALKPAQVQLFREKLPHVQLHNLYGPTEAAIDVTCWTAPDSEIPVVNVPIGKPVANTQLYILDAAGNLAPQGVLGELYLGGIQLARGYLNMPELTKEKFVRNPYSGDVRARLYRTGDICRWLPDGNVEYYGRTDEQVKIRGYRIELGEVENVLQQAPGILQAVVTVMNDRKQLAAYVVTKQVFDAEQVNTWLQHNLPEYMVPSFIIPIESIPLNANGKVDRKQLPAVKNIPFATNEYVAPGNHFEEILAGIWQQVIGSERIGVQDNFFRLGGHSLQVISIISAIRKKLNRELAIREIFLHPTISGLARQLLHVGNSEVPSIRQYNRFTNVPLSFAQERLWFIDKLRGTTQYHLSWVFRLKGELDIVALDAAFRKIIRRHEILRTTIIEEDGAGYQHINDADGWNMNITDQQEIPDLQSYIQEVINHPFNLSTDFMLRVNLIKVSSDEYLMVSVLHHIAFDAWSNSLLVKELIAFYQNTTAVLANPPLQYRDYAIWQREYLSGEILEQKLAYWKQQLQNAEPLELLTDYPRPAEQSTRGDALYKHIGKPVRDGLVALSQQQGVTLFMSLVAVFKILLYRYSGQQNICVGTPVAGRHHQETEGLIGLFVNTLALRSELDLSVSFSNFLQQVKQMALEAYGHQEVPFEKVVDALGIPRDRSRNPVYQVAFTLQNIPQSSALDLGGVVLQAEDRDTLKAQFDMNLIISESPDGMELTMTYCTDLFLQDTIARMLEHYEQMLQQVIENADTPVKEICRLSEAEQLRLIAHKEEVLRQKEERVQQEEIERAAEAGKNDDPRNETERQLVSIWKDLLDVDRVGIYDNFFELGGDSIITIQVVSRARRLGHELKVGDLFSSQTIAELSRILSERTHDVSTVDSEQDTLTGNCGLLPIQQWYFDNPPAAISHYNQSVLLSINKNIEKELLEHALRVLVQHHDALRFRYDRTENGWQQKYGEYAPLLQVENLFNTQDADLPEAIRTIAGRYQQSLDIEKGILIRTVLFETSEKQRHNRLLLVIHHLAVDGVSWRILLEDLELLFAALHAGNDATLGRKRSSYRAWYQALASFAQSEKLLDQKNYWSAMFQQVTPLPVDKEHHEPVTAKNTQHHFVTLSIEQTKQLLQEVPKAYRTEINDILLGALAYTLCSWSKNNNVIIGLEGHGREEINNVDTNRTVGWFTSLYPVMLELEDEAKTSEAALIKSVKEQLRKVPDKGIGYGVLKYITKEPSMQGNDPWEIVFNYLGQVDNVASRSEWFTGASESTGENMCAEHTMHHKLTLNSIVSGGELLINWTFSNYNYEPATVQFLAETYVNTLQSIITHCLEQNKVGPSYTPSDFKLGGIVSGQELDRFLNPRKSIVENIYQLSGLQEGMLFHGLYDKQGSYINHFSSIFINPDIEAFRKSWNYLADRHTILRTAFYHNAFPIPLQCVYKKLEIPFEVLDYRTDDNALQAQWIEEFEEADRRRGINFGEPPMTRVTLLRVSDEKYRMIWTYHHIILDGWSMPVLMQEFLQAYESFVTNSPLPELPEDRYEEYIRYIASLNQQQQAKYWKDYFSGFETGSQLPFISSTANRMSGLGIYDISLLSFDADYTEQVQLFVQQNRITINTLMQAIWSLLLARYTGNHRVTFGVIVSGRPEDLAGVERRVGMYINTLPLHTVVQDQLPVSEWLRHLQQQQVESRKYQHTALSDIKNWIGFEGDLFDTLLVFENYPVDEVITAREWKLQVEQVQTNEHNNYPLSLEIGAGKTIDICFNYNTDILPPAYVKNISAHFKQLLEHIITVPEIAVEDLQIMPDAERRHLIEDFNNTAADYPADKNIVELFAQQTLQTPGAIAMVFENKSYTYAELEACTNQLARYLVDAGAGGESPIPVCLHRSDLLIVTILAILKAGSAYVPIDPGYPAARITYMLQDVQAQMIITRSGIDVQLPDGIQRIDVDTDWPMIAKQADTALTPGLNASSLAYIIYTSGSTGEPKGVMAEHGNVVSLVKSVTYISLNEQTVILSTGSPSFDASTLEYWGTLLNGGRLVLCSQEVLFDAAQLKNIIAAECVTAMFFTTGWFNQLVETAIDLFAPLHMVMTGGERISIRHIKMMKEQYPHLYLMHAYGPTENTTYSLTYNIRTIEPGHEIPIGRPLENRTAYILNEHLQLCSAGVPGELCVGGAGLARGYWQRETLTRERFVEIDGLGRVYRTGDVCRWLPDGNIEFIGRKDNQVKIRGFRVELGEIENALGQVPGIKQAIVIAKADSNTTSKKLVAYIVTDAGFDRAAVTAYLQSKLPEYMIPAAIVQLDELPLNANGKVDQKRLPDPGSETSGEENYQAPRNETEVQLAEIWQDLLGVSRVGINDNFFELGGHSLLAIRLIAALRKTLEREIPIKVVFDYPTIAGFLESLENESRNTALPVITRYKRPARIPLSFAQERIWFIDRLQGSVEYHMPWAFRLHGALDVAALESSFKEIISRHEVLRTVLREEEGEAYQLVLPADSWSMTFVNEKDIVANGGTLQQYMEAGVRRPFDLSADAMMRVHLVHTAREDYVLLIVLHHIAFDGWSISVMVRELAQTYRALVSGNPAGLSNLQIQYADYAIWQREYLSGEKLAAGLSYWKEQLHDIQPLRLPGDRLPLTGQKPVGGYVYKLIDLTLQEQLKELSQKEGATLFMTLLAVFKILLYRYTGQSDISLTTPLAGRRQQELEPLIGFFVNTLILRTPVNAENSFAQLLQKVRLVTLDAYEHQDIPYEKIIQEIDTARNHAQNALFQIMFTLQNMPDTGTLDLGGVDLDSYDTGESIPKLDISFELTESPQGLHLGISYRSDIYSAEAVQRIAAHYEELLKQVTMQPAATVGTLRMLTATEQYRILNTFNETTIDYGTEDTIIDLFSKRVAQTPDAVALVFGNESLTYLELDKRSNRVARYLQHQGICKEQLVGICVDRCPDMVVSILAVLKAGAAYVPLDPSYPQERIAYMLQDSECEILITQQTHGEWLPWKKDANKLICIENLDALTAGFSHDRLATNNKGNDLAYVIYTSGSTGLPKGVMVEHKGVVNLAHNQAGPLALQPGIAVLQFSSLSFDASCYEIFLTLLNGGRLVLCPKEVLLDTSRCCRLLNEQQVDLVVLPPSYQAIIKDEILPVKTIVSAGEALNAALARELMQKGIKLINAYGPTENTVCALLSEDPVHSTGCVTIGRPIGNVTAYILDSYLQPVPEGVAGELFLGGVQVARGYWKRPDLTQEKFIADPFSNTGRLYRTGDVARWLPDGNMEFLGRADDQVKIRGYRIEVAEVQEALGRAAGVKECVVVADSDAQDQLRLIGYVVPGKDYDQAAVLRAMQENLPEYMIPSVLVEIDSIPLTANGKTDKKRLPKAAQVADEPALYQPPQTTTEAQLELIWQTLLGKTQIGRSGNFFLLGGHSLLAIRLVSAIRRRMGKEIPVRNIFNNPTIATLAVVIDQSNSENRLPGIQRNDHNGNIPLSFSQERLWFIDRLQGSVQYHLSWVFRLQGSVNVHALQIAFKQVLQRHSILRTVIREEGGIGYQEILPAEDWQLQLHGQMPSIEDLIQKPFDLSNDLPIRALLVQLPSDEYILAIVLHHIAFDGWSIEILVNELSELYRSTIEERKANLKELPVQYADYAIWQRQQLSGEALRVRLAYWTTQLHGVEPLQLPADFVRPPEQSMQGEVINLQIENDIKEALITFSQQEGVTLFMTMLGIFKALLYRYTGQQDICIGTPVAGRDRDEVEGLIGFFVNTLALRSRVTGNIGFSEFLQQIRRTTLDAYERQDVPFEKIVEALEIERDISRNPVFQVMFTVQDATGTTDTKFPGITLSSENDARNVHSPFDLSIDVTSFSDGMSLTATYASDLYKRETVENMLRHYVQLMRSILPDSEIAISRLQLLGVEEQDQLLNGFNNTSKNYAAGKTLPALFEEQVQKTPNATAVCFDQSMLTYGELNAQANRLAHYLLAKGVERNQLVPVCMERCPEMIVAILGILKAGAAYVPIDPQYPVHRVEYILNDTRANIVVAMAAFSHLFANSTRVDVVLIDSHNEKIAVQPAEKPAIDVQPEHLAYVIYTSGSTGVPKGVMNAHTGVVNRLVWGQEYFELNETDAVLQKTTFCFDVSVWELFWPLIAGARLVFAKPGGQLDNDYLLKAIDEHTITTVHFVPSMLEAFLESCTAGSCASLKRVMCSGEAMKRKHVELFRQTFPKLPLYNLYGPTEAAIEVSCWAAPENFTATDVVSIGKPVANTRLYILDKDNNLMPASLPGELHIGGVQVARGYLNLPGQTRERFITDPFDGNEGARLYKTGDWCRWLPDGNIEYLGRLDEQVKVHGYRIELGEIERTLQQVDGVKQAVAVVIEDKIIAYVTTGINLDAQSALDFLKERLPAYMVPARIITLDNIPLNTNGKVDRKKLMQIEIASVQTAYKAPRNALEARMALVWQQMLGLERVGVTDNFFALGGHSLLAMRMVSAMRKQLQKEIAVKEIFYYPTIEKLSSQLGVEGHGDLLPVIEKYDRPKNIPLSFAQERLWFIDKLQGSVQYHLSFTFVLHGTLDAGALEDAFRSVVHRHEVLRTVIHEHEGTGYQVILPFDQWHIDLNEEIEEYITRPFDLSTDYPLRALLVRIDAEQHQLVIVAHHIAFDGWSLPLLKQELLESYNKKPAFEPLPIQYADYTLWQRKYLSGETLNKKLDWWKQQLQNVPALELVRDHIPPAVRTINGALVGKTLNAGLHHQLVLLAQSQNATLFMTLLSAFKILLYRYTGQQDICIGTPVAGRQQQELEKLIGFFVNNLALRTNVCGHDNFTSVLNKVRQTTLDAYEHQEVPFEKIVEALEVERDMNRNPVFQVVFMLEHDNGSSGSAMETVRVLNDDAKASTTQFDISFQVSKVNDTLQLTMSYSTDLFSNQTMARLLEHYEQLLHEIVKDQSTPVAQLSLLSANEERQLKQDFNDTASDYPAHKTIVEVFAEQVLLTPGATAIIYADESLTYKELDERSNQFAHHLISIGVKPGDVIPVCIYRSISLIISIIGVIKAGAAYVPIDPDYPQQRIDYMTQDIGADMVITQDMLNIIADQPRIAPVVEIKPSALAYVMYTSGSTGTPKGVMVEHGNIVSLVKGVDYITLNKETTLLATGSPSFDASTLEYWGTLLNGARLVLCSQETLMDTRLLSAVIKKENVNMMWFTAGWFSQLVETDISLFAQLQTVMAGGDRLSARHVAKVKQQYPHLRIINGYGPTENTTFSLTYDVTQVITNRELPIGRPLQNRMAYILNENLQLCATGIAGEICVGGAGLARGYWQRETLTNERFIEIPGLGRVYRTGDTGRWLPDGNIEFIGRKDEQVKIRGYRVELTEIEAVLQQAAGVRQAVVIAKADEENANNKTLVAYVVTENGLNKPMLNTYLQSRLPDYMIPSVLMQLDELPLTANGKIDRKRLPLPVSDVIFNDHVAPSGQLEERLAEIWKDLLKKERVGVTDNFFESGGHSILMVRLLHRLRAIKYDLRLRDLFAYQTIRSLASALQQQNAAASNQHLLLLQEVKKGLPLFIIPGSDGFSDGYDDLAHAFKNRCSVYGIQMRGLLPGEEPLTRIEDIAAENITWIQQVQPTGPYKLAGHSFGGIVAYEMARQLEAAGEKVDTLVILDMPAKLEVHPMAVTDPVGFVIEIARTTLVAGGETDYLLRLLKLQSTNLRINHQISGSINSRIVVVKAADRVNDNHDETLGWREHSSEVHAVTVPGDHFSMVRGSNAARLAKKIF